MFKKVIGFIVIGLMLVCGNALALRTGVYEKGVLVPVTMTNPGSMDTVVGIICSEQTEVYWSIFDSYSNPIIDGQFSCTQNDYELFSVSKVLGVPVKGYMVFTANAEPYGQNGASASLVDDCKRIAANAFVLDFDTNDAMYVPVIPLPFKDYASNVDLTKMNKDSVVHLTNGFTNDGGFVDVRYWYDPEMNGDTTVVVWTTRCLKANKKLSDNCYVDIDDNLFCHADVFDADEHRISLNIPLGCELSIFNPVDIDAWPGFTDGFFRVPKSNFMPFEGDGAIAFSYITSDVFKATQTLLASEVVVLK